MLSFLLIDEFIIIFVVVWQQDTTEQIHQLKHTNDINAVSWNPNNNNEDKKLILATCSDDGLVMLFTLDCDNL